MGNTQDKLPVRVQEELNKKYMVDFELCVKDLEETLSYSVDMGVIYRKLYFEQNKLQNVHPIFPVFLKDVSQRLKRPHIIIGVSLYFVFSALQSPYLETTNADQTREVVG